MSGVIQGSAILKAFWGLGRLSLIPLAALLLALHPVALQMHVYMEGEPSVQSQTSGGKSVETDGACHCGKCDCSHHGHKRAGCPVCQLLGLMASACSDLQVFEDWTLQTAPLEPLAHSGCIKAFPSPFAPSSSPRAPPCAI